MIILKNGLINENDKLVKKDILIKNDRIALVSDEIWVDNVEVYDIDGYLVMPGAVDVHVHLREPGFRDKETIKSGTLSAAKGGVTTIMAMPNLNPFPDCVEGLKVEQDIIDRDALVNVYPYACVSEKEMNTKLVDIDSLAPYVKAFSDDGKGVNNVELLTKAMELVKKHDLIIASHAEDDVDGYLPQGEYVAVKREIELAKQTGVKYHFCHMSTKESFEYIKKAQEDGVDVTCEVSPHHLFLNEEMINGNPNFKMNPPLRSEENRKASVKALLDGVATMIASDHAPHTVGEKSLEYNKCPNGIIGLETMIPLVYTNLVVPKIASVGQMIAWLVTNPAKRFNLEYSEIKSGSKADIAVLDIKNYREYTKEEILSKGCNSPFIGQSLTGFTYMTLVNGKIVYKKEMDQ